MALRQAHRSSDAHRVAPSFAAPPRGKPLRTKSLAVLLELSGLGMNRMATLLGVSAQSGLNWGRAVAIAHDETPQPTGKAVTRELDERWPEVKKPGANAGSGKPWIGLQDRGVTARVAVGLRRPGRGWGIVSARGP